MVGAARGQPETTQAVVVSPGAVAVLVLLGLAIGLRG
jgi:hypothetical protein